MRQHFGDSIHRAIAEQRMPDRQHQSPTDTKFRVGPQRIECGCHTALNRILHRNHSNVAITGRQMLHNSPQRDAWHQLRRGDGLQGKQ